MLSCAATVSPVRQFDQVDLTAALAAARRALEHDLKTLIGQLSRSGNFDVSVVPAQAETNESAEFV
jgi:flagellar hook-length control protein FliK